MDPFSHVEAAVFIVSFLILDISGQKFIFKLTNKICGCRLPVQWGNAVWCPFMARHRSKKVGVSASTEASGASKQVSLAACRLVDVIVSLGWLVTRFSLNQLLTATYISGGNKDNKDMEWQVSTNNIWFVCKMTKWVIYLPDLEWKPPLHYYRYSAAQHLRADSCSYPPP